MVKKDFGLNELKEQYKKLQDVYNLPGFEDLNKEFNIEKISESETELLTREIRRFIADKIYNYLKLVEIILNPVNAPMFIFSIIKLISSEDKKKLRGIYNNLSDIDLELIILDINYSEENDAGFIKRVYNSWVVIKKELSDILRKVNRAEDKRDEKPNGAYFR